MIKHIKSEFLYDPLKPRPDLKSSIFYLCSQDTKATIRFVLAVLEDVKEFIYPFYNKEKKEVIDTIIDFADNWLKDVNIKKLEIANSTSNGIREKFCPYMKLYHAITWFYMTRLRMTDFKNTIFSIIEYIVNKRMDLGGITLSYINNFYIKLAYAFLSTSSFKIEIEDLKDTTDVLMLIDILQDNDVPIIKDVFIAKNCINLPFSLIVKAKYEDIEKNVWLKQWFLNLFSK